MANVGESGNIGNITIEWRIDDFFSSTEASNDPNYFLTSPTFSASQVLWQLRLFLNWDNRDAFMNLFICKMVERKQSVVYYIAFKKFDSVEQIASGYLKGEEVHTHPISLIKKSDLLQRKSELVPCNCLTIICTLKIIKEEAEEVAMNSSFQPPELDKTKPSKLIRLDKLSENFKNLFHDKETCDIILKVDGKEYRAHRSILIARSKVFAATFKHDTLEKETGIVTITDCDPDAFQKFLEYLYFGKLEELSFHSALNLYYASNKYDIEELKAFCVEYLIQSITIENICELIVFADTHDDTQLFTEVQDFFNKKAFEILLTPEWDDLMEKYHRLASKLLKEMSKKKIKK